MKGTGRIGLDPAGILVSCNPHPINRISTYLSTLSTGSTRYLVLILCLSISGRIKNVDKYKKDMYINPVSGAYYPIYHVIKR
mgnify:CR=1 FL=1